MKKEEKGNRDLSIQDVLNENNSNINRDVGLQFSWLVAAEKKIDS